MKIKERYIWIAFFLVVAAVSIYFGLYYKQPMALSVSIQAPQSAATYPYQSVMIPITINNTGQAEISNLPLGLYVNGNVTQNYKATIPVGKHATINYSLYPTAAGTYVVSLIADPGRLYDFSNRSQTQSSVSIIVSQPEKPEPYINFEKGAISQDIFNLGDAGFAATLLFDNFTNRFYLTGSQGLNKLLYPVINVYAQYINQMVLSHAYYSNYSLASLWISGPLSENAVSIAAIGKGYNLNHTTIGNLNVSFIDVGNSTTLCSWYANGWTKILMSIFGKSCTEFINSSAVTMNYSDLYFMLNNRNVSILNYSGFSGNLTFAGDVALASNSVVYEGLEKGVNFSNVCTGNILNFSNNSYCYGSLWASNTTTLTQINRLNGPYNLSIWTISFANNSASAQLYALNLSAGYGHLGAKHPYVSAFVSVCGFNSKFPCLNPKFTTTSSSSNLTLSILNNYNRTITLNGMSCSSYGNAAQTKLGVKVGSGKNATVSVPCYNNGQLIEGVTPLYIVFSLELNYTYGASTNITQGYVEITK